MKPTKSKTLIILSPAFPADESETVWVRPKQLFVRLLHQNYPSLAIILLAFNYPLHTNEYNWRGIKVIPFGGLKAKRIQRIMLWVRIWRQLKQLQKQHDILGILSFWCGECALVGKRFARRHGLKHFIWISGMDAKKDNKLVRFIRPTSEGLVAMSVFLQKEFYKNHLVKPSHVIPIGIDPEEFPLEIPERNIDLLGVGSLNDFKQYDLFIRIVKALCGSFPNINAVICGEGSERQALEKQISQLGLSDRITLTGLTRHDEVLRQMQRAKIFLHPSAYEGFGAVCIEALYAGCQVISFNDPMEMKVQHWHVVQSEDEMRKTALDLLKRNESFERVMLFSMSDTARSMMRLFER